MAKKKDDWVNKTLDSAYSGGRDVAHPVKLESISINRRSFKGVDCEEWEIDALDDKGGVHFGVGAMISIEDSGNVRVRAYIFPEYTMDISNEGLGNIIQAKTCELYDDADLDLGVLVYTRDHFVAYTSIKKIAS